MDKVLKKAYKQRVKLKKQTLALLKNKDWKTVIEEAYFKEEASRLPKALVDDNMQGEVDQRLITEKIRAIGHLQLFITHIMQMGSLAEEELQKAKEEQAKDIEMDYDEITGDPITN